MSQYHFISGLPRSGSTLLAGILRQNNFFHAAMSSPVAGLMNGTLEQMAAGSEFHAFFDDAKRKQMCQAIFAAYYSEYQDKQVIFDTNRIWSARMHQLVELFGTNFKMICCVRNPAWIMDSFERIYRKNPFEYSRMYSPQMRQTVYSRCEGMMNAQGVAGSAWTALKEAYYGEFSEQLLLLDYDLLVSQPQQCMQLIYQFMEQPLFTHDFDNVEYQEGEFDAQLGAKGLHTVKKKVAFTPRRSILPPDLFEKYKEMEFWKDTAGTNASIIAAKKNNASSSRN